MTASDWNLLLTISGTVASVAGVVFSWMAWVQAGKAKDAAREASEAVRQRNTALEFLRLAADAKEMLSAVQQHRTDNAIATANGLVQALSILRTRSVADSSDTITLKTCVNDIMSVAIRLTVDRVPADPSRFEELVMLCSGIHRTICDLTGRLEKRSEGASL